MAGEAERLTVWQGGGGWGATRAAGAQVMTSPKCPPSPKPVSQDEGGEEANAGVAGAVRGGGGGGGGGGVMQWRLAVGWLSVPARYRSLPKRLVWTGGAPRQSGLQLRPAGTHTRVPVPPRAPSLLPLLLPPIRPRWNLFLYLLDHSHPVTVTLQGGKGCSWRACSRGKGFGQSATLGRGGRKG